MKSLLSFIVAFGFAVSLNAQSSPSQTESFGGIEVGFFTGNIFYENAIAPSLSLRSELGGYFGYGRIYEQKKLYGSPYLSVSPRYYFNLNRRSNKGKNTSANAADFFELRNDVIMTKDFQTFRQLSFIPTIGHRRNIGNLFHYEIALGAGLTRNFIQKQNELGIHLRLNIGLHR